MNFVLARDPRSAPALCLRAAIHLRAARIGAVLADLDKGIESEPSDPACLFLRAKVFMSQRRFEDARRDLDRAIDSAPDAMPARKMRAQIHGFLKDWKGAVADYDFIILNDPKDAGALASRGVVRTQMGEIIEADLRRAGILRPGDSAIAYNHAVVLNTLARHDDALAVLAPLLRLKAVPADVWTLQGILLAATGDLPKATEALEHALAADPDHARALRERARVWTLRGDTAKSAADTAATGQVGSQ